jgi:endonuclease-3 related protein
MNLDHLLVIYGRLYEAYGPQHWWPAQTPFEVMVGAILTQNTAWANVERAILNLKQADCLDAESISSLKQEQLAELIRPAGYFNIKAKRLMNFITWYVEYGGQKKLGTFDTLKLRNMLLNVNGIGPETADDILLYAFERPVFVIDAYTRRLFARLGLINGDEAYEDLRSAFESVLDKDVPLYNEYHALIVRHAKEKCARSQDCNHCDVEAPLGR